MNLQSKKARIPIAALGVTALCSAGLGIFASPAMAVGQSLSFAGSVSSATILKTDPTASPTAAGLTYGTKINGITGTDPLYVSVLTAPAPSAVLYAERAAGSGAPQNATFAAIAGVTTADATAGSKAVTLDAAPTSTITGDLVLIGTGASAFYARVASGGTTANIILADPAPATFTGTDIKTAGSAVTHSAFTTATSAAPEQIAGYSSGDNLYFGSNTEGTYTLQAFQDTNGDGIYQANLDSTTPTFTVNVKKPEDSFTLDTPATVAGGTKQAKAKATTTLSTEDIRGGSPSTLGTNIAAQTSFTLADSGSGGTGVTGLNTSPVAGQFSTADGIFAYLSGGVNGATALGQGITTPNAFTTTLKYGVTTVGSARSTSITSNGVATLTNVVAADQTDNVDIPVAGTIKVRPGTAAVTYTATAKDNASTPAAVAGATVTFTLTAGSGIALTDLTANGAAVPASGEVNVTTGTDGTAKLVVSSAKTANGNAYTVDASSGTATSSPSLSVAYQTAAVDTVKITSTSAELTPAVGTASVTVKGKLIDQYGKDFQPPSSDSQQVAVSGAATGNVVPTAGAFSYTFTPTTPPTAGTTQTLTFTYGAKTANAVINWASSAAAATVTLSAPADKATGLALQNVSGPGSGIAVTGTVLDSTNAGLAYKGVKLSGDDGVWFATASTPDADHPLSATLDTVASNSGALQGAYVFFTKSGDHKVTATAGTATATSNVTANAPVATAGWNVTVNDVNGAPGSTLILTGKVTDVFGNPVSGAVVSLNADPSTVGALGSTTVTTNAAGVFSTTFVTGTNSSGDVKVTAEITNNGGTLTPAAAWKTAGVTLKDAVDKVTGAVTVAATKLTLSATAKVVAGGSGGTAKLSGKYLPDTSVDIWSKESGEKTYSLMDSVMTDGEGEWGISTKVARSTYFLAKANGLSSPSDVTEVWSAVSLTAKALGKGKVQLSANGDPNVKAPLNFYRSIAGKDPLLKKVTSSSSGVAKVTVSLPKGVRSVYVTYKAPGTTLGQSKTVKVTVK